MVEMEPIGESTSVESNRTAETAAWAFLKDRYLVERELGRGGFAVTYLALDRQLALRRVVVKVLNEAHGKTADYLANFRAEIEALARIDHPHVVGVIDCGELPDGRPFLVLQYVPGENLRQYLRRGRLPLGAVGRIVLQLSEALTAAHEAGVIHRDIKPENVMISLPRNGGEQAKLIDFGVAGLREAGSGVPSSRFAGTLAYMAPERVFGESSPQSDTYELGIVAYEMVTGEVPLEPDRSDASAAEKMEATRQRLRELRPELPVRAARAIVKALAFRPEDRFQSAESFGLELAAALNPFSSTQQELEQRINDNSFKRFPYRTWLVAVAVVSVLIAIGAYLRYSGQEKIDSIAVLPFASQTADSENNYLSEGITEALINDLSSIPTLRVAALGSVLKYKGRNVDPRVPARELGVNNVIEGSVKRKASDFEISTELIDARAGTRRWGTRYSAKVALLPEILERFSIEVTDQLKITLSGPLKQRLAKQYKIGSSSYEQYLKGRYYLNKRTVGSFNQAIKYFEEVNASDPLYAPAYAGLADTYALMAAFGPFWGGSDPRYALERARAAAEHSLQLDGTLAEAYNALAMVEVQREYRWESSQRDYLRAIAFNPNAGEIHENYALELSALGEVNDALRQIGRAEEIEPENQHYRAAHGMILFMARRYDESLAVYQEIAKTPDGMAWVADAMSMDYLMKGDAMRALKSAEAIPESNSELRDPLMSAAYARLGMREKALALVHDSPNSGEHWWYLSAIARLNLNQREEALQDLETAYRERWEDLVWIGVDPLLDELRSTPRFTRLLEQTHLDKKSN